MVIRNGVVERAFFAGELQKSVLLSNMFLFIQKYAFFVGSDTLSVLSVVCCSGCGYDVRLLPGTGAGSRRGSQQGPRPEGEPSQGGRSHPGARAAGTGGRRERRRRTERPSSGCAHTGETEEKARRFISCYLLLENHPHSTADQQSITLELFCPGTRADGASNRPDVSSGGGRATRFIGRPPRSGAGRGREQGREEKEETSEGGKGWRRRKADENKKGEKVARA